jgi:hypothetical protein
MKGSNAQCEIVYMCRKRETESKILKMCDSVLVRDA